jgi:hypothetical protein
MGWRFSIRRLMLLVAALAVILGAARLGVVPGSFAAGVVLVALVRGLSVIDRLPPGERPPSLRRRAVVSLSALAGATAIMTSATAACLSTIVFFTSLFGPHDFWPFGVAFMVLGVGLAALIGRLVSRAIWPPAPKHREVEDEGERADPGPLAHSEGDRRPLSPI